MKESTELEVLANAALSEEVSSKAYKIALEMFLMGVSVASIASATKTSINTIKRWIIDYKWDKALLDKSNAHDLLANEAPIEFAKRAVSKLVKVIYYTAKEYDEKIANGELKLLPKDLDRLTVVLSNLDKIIRLESGRPTDIHALQAISYEEARNVLLNDPFAKGIIDAEYKHK